MPRSTSSRGPSASSRASSPTAARPSCKSAASYRRRAPDKSARRLRIARDQASGERDTAERELTQRFVTAGTILNLNRVDHPKLQPLFARVDELKNGVNAREAAIVRLESERRSYDRAAVQKGLLTVGIAVGAFIILLIILIVLIKR